MLKKFFMLTLCLLPLGAAKLAAQQGLAGDDLSRLRQLEDSLILTADSMYTAPIPEERTEILKRFVRQLRSALAINNSWQYGFDSLANHINILYPEDRSFRIFNWAVAPSEVTRRYYGAIQMPSEKLKLYPLVDYTSELGNGAEDSVLRGGKWYGCLYYRILTREVEGEKVYTMFGLNAASPVSNKKVLDALSFSPDGPVFGAPIFGIRSRNYPSKRVNRYIMEYKKDVQASLNWDNEMQAIYFDRLTSQVNDPNRKYTYVPSGQYDGFRWANGEWKLVEDLIPVQMRKDGEAPAGEPR